MLGPMDHPLPPPPPPPLPHRWSSSSCSSTVGTNQEPCLESIIPPTKATFIIHQVQSCVDHRSEDSSFYKLDRQFSSCRLPRRRCSNEYTTTKNDNTTTDDGSSRTSSSSSKQTCLLDSSEKEGNSSSSYTDIRLNKERQTMMSQDYHDHDSSSQSPRHNCLPSRRICTTTTIATGSSRSTLIRFDDSNITYFEDTTIWTQQDKNATWYSKEEYRDIHGELDDTAELIATGLLENPGRGDHCLRGLEYKAHDAKERRRKNIRKSQRAVFRIQDQFYRLRIRDEKRGGGGRGIGRTISSGSARKNQSSQGVMNYYNGYNHYNKRSTQHTTIDDSRPSIKQNHSPISTKEDEQHAIAIAYQKYSFPCHMEAQKVGLWDAREVSRLWSEDKSPKPPRRTWAKAG